MKHLIRISLVALLGLALYRPAVAQIGIGISVNFAPPALPVYEQPLCPGDGYLWTPGYWAWDADDADYYWVPGTWIMAPQPGYLWTPAWWGYEGGAYGFHEGYWGTEVGWYGGISYGFGYWGHGFYGGRWEGGHFMYNRAVFNVDDRVHNVYEDRTVIVNRREETHVSYNGGEGGVTERPTPQEEAASRGQHFPRARAQEENRQAARSNPQMRASNNQGKPAVAATAHAGEFTGHDVVAAKSAGGEYHAPANKGRTEGGAKPETGGARPEAGTGAANPGHARDLQPHQVPTPESGATVDKKTQAQQQKLVDKQNQEHQKLAQQQQKEDQKAEQQKWNDPKKQQMEQKHSQQTQQMEQRHTQQQQRVQPKPKKPE